MADKIQDELDLVDEDIREFFKSPMNQQCGYFKGTPTMMQLVKEMKKLNENFEKLFKGGANGSK